MIITIKTGVIDIDVQKELFETIKSLCHLLADDAIIVTRGKE